MSRPSTRPEFEAARLQTEADQFAAALRAVRGDDTRPALPWDEGLEQQMTYLTETRDDETGEHPPLRKRNR